MKKKKDLLKSQESTNNSTRFSWKSAENAAISFLKRKGYKILSRNFRTKFGEIDIIALDDDTLVFIEVKSGNSDKVDPFERITNQKISKIERVAEFYMNYNRNFVYSRTRIDAIKVHKNKIFHQKGITDL
ncbi:YraN family protein [Thermosipho ferrireducens]|uniref:UPF0102 protein JYK00_05020 n=1 Tax=Thermosipho ferrireducens TaxID=2571116 RepID=A0ABX7S8J1_9BACT|nr:YraN family protein [Thermosipho ferrireducens]QTA38917.1 YraN family protein [Thermosipho ferrireducens]